MTALLKQRPNWVIWLLFFLQFAGIGIYMVFLNVYYREAGLSGTQIGLINMVSSLLSIFGVLLWGHLSDRTGKPRLLMAVGAASVMAVAQLVPLVHSFLAFLILACFSGLMGSSVFTLLDSTTLAMLGDKREDYGRFRLGGTVGFIATTALAGPLFDWGGLRLIFPSYGIIMAAFALLALMLPSMPVHVGSRSGGSIGQMVRQPAWLLFAAVMFLTWMASNGSIQFLSVSLNSMGASQTVIGLVSTVAALIEIPFMAKSGALLRRFGPVKLLWISMLLMTLRYLLLAWMRAPEWAILINAINGPGYVLYWTSAVTYASKMAPPSLAATSMAMFNSTISLAGMVSSLVSGALFDLAGPHGVFYVLAAFCLAAFILFFLGQARKLTLQDEVVHEL